MAQKHNGKVTAKVESKPPWGMPPWGDKERVRLSVITTGGDVVIYVGPKHPLARMKKGQDIKFIV